MKLNTNITLKEVNKIFSNTEEKKEYLKLFYETKKINKKLPSRNINNEIIDTWDYEISKQIIRDMFRNTKKYNIGKNSNIKLDEMIKEWNKLKLGNLDWPFVPIMFDQYIQKINVMNISEKQKDEIVKKDIVKFRRIKKINTFRNDYIEYLVFENNENIIPTLKHNRSVDFYINGFPYDQKVSRSVTKEFQNYYGDNWRQTAIKHPEIVAEYLYKYQDEARFGSESRLLVIYLDEDVSSESVSKCVEQTSFDTPLNISFEYTHSDGTIKEYSVECYVIMIYKK